MKIVTTTVIAMTELKNNELTLCYEGKSSNTSSGSFWGGCRRINIPDECPVDVLKNIVRAQNEWLQSYENPETGELIKVAIKFYNIVTLNGKKIIIDNNGSLLNYS